MRPVEAEHDAQRLVMEAIQAGDAHAMAEFMGTHARWVRAVVFGVLGRATDLDDVVQKVWIQVWRQARSLEDCTRWKPWLYRIARNCATDLLRANQRRRRLFTAIPESSNGEVLLPINDKAGPDGELGRQERQRAMLEAIGNLPPLYREPFVLKHLENCSYAEIGEALGLPADTVETRLVRARRLLREQLAGRI